MHIVDASGQEFNRRVRDLDHYILAYVIIGLNCCVIEVRGMIHINTVTYTSAPLLEKSYCRHTPSLYSTQEDGVERYERVCKYSVIDHIIPLE